MAEELFDRSWMNVIKFNCREFSPGVVGVHVWRAPHRCFLMTVTSAQLQDPAFPLWQHIHAEAKRRWLNEPPVIENLCPRCSAFLRLSRRIYEGREFCQTCGEHLTA